MYRLLIIILMIFILSGISVSQNLNVIPKPQEATFLEGEFSIENPNFSIKVSLEDTLYISIPIAELIEEFKLTKNYMINSDKNLSRNIWIGIPEDDEKFKSICEENGILQSEKIGEQGYSLLIKDELILIAADTKKGLYYGVQTLKQIIRSNQLDSSLPSVKIIDWPEMKYRGILDDISRGPLPTMAYMKQQIRRLAELKMNTLQYYTEHVIKTDKHAAFSPPDGSYTIEDIKELTEYARMYHVELIGNFQSFGHFEKILSHPDYAHLGESGTLLSPAFPESEELLRDIFSEMVPAFDSKYFNVNADETFDLGKGASKSLVDSLGLAIVYTDFVNKMYRILDSLGVRMMMWTDILLKHPGSIKMIPKDVIMMTWGYDDGESFDDMIIPFKEEGFEFTISPGVLNSYSTFPNYSITTTNIKNFARDGIKHGAMGMVLTVWDDGGSAFFSRDWYGVAYGSEHSWNSNDENISDFNRRFSLAAYGDASGKFSEAITKLVELAGVPVTDRLQEKLLWTKVIPDSGESLRIGIDGWDKVIEIIEAAESFLNESKPLLYQDDLSYFMFTINQYRYFADLRSNLLNAAQSYSQAYHNQNSQGFKVRESLIDAVNKIGSSRNSMTDLYNDYRALWLKENKTYAVNLVLKKYQDQIDELRDIEERIFLALKNFDSGFKIPTPSDVRLGIEKGEGKYFREWMMINPIPNPERNRGTSIDYLKEMGGELNAVPKVTQEFEYKEKTYRWRRTASEYFDIVDIDEEFPSENKNSVTYAFANIDSPDDRVVTAAIGISGAAEVIINGKIAYSSSMNRQLKIDGDTFQLPLKKGRNNLMLKLFNAEEEWKLTFRLPDYDVSNSKNRYKIPDEK